MKGVFDFLLLLNFLNVAVNGANIPFDSVQTLTSARFDDAVFGDPANGFWFLKFYAPWCGHCKRLAPVLQELAPKLKGKMAIGHIDCTIEKKLCNRYGVKGYPTLKFARDGDVYDYPGSRSAEDIIDFARKMSSPAITTVSSYEDAIERALETEQGIGFVVYSPQVSGETLDEQLLSTTITQVAAQVSRKRQATAAFFLYTGDQPGAFGVKEGEFVVKIEEHVAPVVWTLPEEIHSPALLEWVDETNYPLVSVLGPNNFNRLGNAGKLMAMGIVDGGDADMVATIKNQLADYATNGPEGITNQYRFGVLDGKKWGKFLEQFEVSGEIMPQFLVLDVPTREYWLDPNYKTVKTFLEAIDNGDIKMQDHHSHRGFVGKIHKLEHWFFRNMPYTLIGLVLIALTLVCLILPNPDDMRPPYPREEVAAAQESKKDK